MNKIAESVAKKAKSFELGKLNNLFIILSIFYLILYVVFIGGGPFSRLLLGIYSVLILFVCLVQIVLFVHYFADFVNAKSSQYGDLFKHYIFNFFAPVAVLKLFGFVLFKILPKHAEGIVCDMVCFVKDLFWLYKFQYYLEMTLVFSLIAMVVFLLLSMLRNRN